jgi:uncharacterized membrane protein
MKAIRSHVQILLSGILALLPLAVTAALLIWVGTVLQRFIGPQSQIGRFLSSVGLAFVTDEIGGYCLGILFFLGLAYIVGTLVQSRFRKQLERLTDSTLRRVPLIGPVYDLTSRFVGMIERRERSEVQSMAPVWCTFGGDSGVAVLALMPNPEPVTLGGHAYLAVLVPTAPVPFGGGLLYVPAAWVKPAGLGIDQLASVYVSMGVTPPTPLPSESSPS